jgi:hypothetical protein
MEYTNIVQNNVNTAVISVTSYHVIRCSYLRLIIYISQTDLPHISDLFSTSSENGVSERQSIRTSSVDWVLLRID